MKFSDQQLNLLYRYAYSLTRDRDWAHDLVSFALEKILVRPWVIKKNAYLKTIVRNKFYDEYKRSLKLEALEAREISVDSLEEILISKDELQFLLEELAPEDRELLYLWAVEEYSLEEISKLWNVSKGTLCSKVYRLRKKLVEKSREEANE